MVTSVRLVGAFLHSVRVPFFPAIESSTKPLVAIFHWESINVWDIEAIYCFLPIQELKKGKLYYRSVKYSFVILSSEILQDHTGI